MTLPPKQHRHSTCHRHPSKPITGFCASCLRERLSGIDPDTHLETPINPLAIELRRTKSHSSTSTTATTHHHASSSSTFSTSEDSRRKSCDVQPHNSLSDLFHLDDKRKPCSNRLSRPLLCKHEETIEDGEMEVTRVRVCESVVINQNRNEIEEENGDSKIMKELIDLECERKRNAGSFRVAASFFSKKLGKWQRKQRCTKGKRLDHGADLPSEMTNGNKYVETQSEIGEYGLGRRSCDTEPRLSIDVARFSFDEPRASWDGCLIGKSYPRLTPMVSVVEDGNLTCEDDNVCESSPGGTVQTTDYYSERRRRQSFDRSASSKRAGIMDDEMKLISNAKVSPETVGLFHGAKLLFTEKELKNSNWYSLKDSTTENVDSLVKDVVCSVAGGSGKKGFEFNRWSSVRKMWNLLPKRNERKFGAEEQLAGSFQTPRVSASSREPSGFVSQKLLRSYTVSARDSSATVPSIGSIETKEDGLKRREELMLQRNRSARYSPNNLDNGLLRFYLTPIKGSRRSTSGKSRLKNSDAMTSNVS